jgi:MFS family permease
LPTALLLAILAKAPPSGPAATTTAPSPPSTVAPGDTGVNLVPNQSNLPGAQVIHNLANGIGSWALIAAMLGIVVGAVIWAFGNYSQNYQQAYNGRRGVMVSGIAAVLIGAAPHVITFLFGQGGLA